MTGGRRDIAIEVQTEMRRRRRGGQSYRSIAEDMGYSDTTVRKYTQDEARLTFASQRDRRRLSDDAAARLAEIPNDTRDITGRAFGDPLPGRSALDQMRGV